MIGTGEIAGDFTDALHAHTDQRVVAVSSRTLDRAERFAASHGVATAVAGYATRYRTPSERADRVAIEIAVDGTVESTP